MALAGWPVEQPGWLLLIPIAAVLLFFLIRKDFVRLPLDNIERRRRRRRKVWVYVSRLLITILVVIALTTPYLEITEESAGNPQITLLVDQSDSMAVLDTAFLDGFRDVLQQRVPVTVRTIATGETSEIGDAILDNLEPGSQVLLVSDGNVVSGTSLENVAFFAANSLNATISAVQLEEKERDSSVFILGPEKVVAGTSNTYVVHITSTSDGPVPLQVLIDGQIAYDKATTERVIAFEKELPVGSHRLEARITPSPDKYPQNNEFFRTVDVLEKPRILLLTTKDSLLESVLGELYTVTKTATLPDDLSPYYAVVANDVKASKLNNVQALHDFLIDDADGYYGGGLVVVGGFDSYDRGDYKNAPIESLLPVKVGKGESKKGDDNIVIILDISGGTTGVRYEKECDAAGNCRFVERTDQVSALDIIKAQAVNLIGSEKNIIATNKVAVIAFGVQGTLEQTGQQEYQASDTVKVIESLDFLYNNQARLKEKIPRLVGGGPSEIGIALNGAYDLLKDKRGQSNYILLLTDGNVAPSLQQQAMSMVEQLKRRGVKVFTYGVGRSTPNVKSDFLTALAQEGDGLYEGPVITTNQVNPARISIQWGNPDQKGFGDEFGLIPFSLTHFITRDLELTAVLNGFNQVTPKSTAQMLVTTDFGQPALTVWNYGNGRVATLTVFTGSGLGQLLNAENSLLITRTVNWAIGDPQRKQDFFITIDDARVGQQTTVTVRSKETLSSSDVEFVKDGDLFRAQIVPPQAGFNTFFGATYAANYAKEYQRVGMNPELNDTVTMTNGKIFSPEDIDSIVEHATEMSRRQTVRRVPFTWPFLSAALVIFLIEVFLRRIRQYQKE